MQLILSSVYLPVMQCVDLLCGPEVKENLFAYEHSSLLCIAAEEAVFWIIAHVYEPYLGVNCMSFIRGMDG